MKPVEMDKFMLWLLGVFPQWSPDKAVSAMWAKELPQIKADEAINAARVVMEKKPSPFPPGIFEIKAALRKHVDPVNEAKVLFNYFWGGMREDIGVVSEIAQKALRLVGGGYGQALTEDRAWHEKRFVDIYCGLVEREAVNGQGYTELLGPGRRESSQGNALLVEGRACLEERAGGVETKGVRA